MTDRPGYFTLLLSQHSQLGRHGGGSLGRGDVGAVAQAEDVGVLGVLQRLLGEGSI